MLSERATDELKRLTSPPAGTRLYGIIDGASVPNFRHLARASSGRHECLFAGPLHLEVERAAPHLVELEPEGELTLSWWRDGWGEHWGILAQVPVEWSFKEVRRHFRRFLRVQLPDRRRVLFRYYDPRVLRTYIPTCTADETATLFGPVTTYFAEGDSPATVLRFKPGPTGAILQRMELPE